MFPCIPLQQRHLLLSAILVLAFAPSFLRADDETDVELLERAREASNRFVLPEARALLEPLLTRNLTDEPFMLENARLLSFEKKHYEAWHQIRALLELYPKNATALNLRALVNIEWNKDVKAAFEDLNLALQHDPAFTKAYLNRARVLKAAGKPELALADADQAVKLDPADFAVRLHRGMIYLDLNKQKEALESFDAAIRISPNNIDARLQRAWVLAIRPYLGATPEQGLATLKADIDQILSLNPKHEEGLILRGRYFEASDNHANAFDAYFAAHTTLWSDLPQPCKLCRVRPFEQRV